MRITKSFRRNGTCKSKCKCMINGYREKGFDLPFFNLALSLARALSRVAGEHQTLCSLCYLLLKVI